MRFSHVKSTYFRSVFANARQDSDQIREATSPYETVRGTQFYLWSNGTEHAGFGVRADGELVYVFSTTRGMGNAIVADAIAHGATRLDCFDGHLSTLYARHGFVETDRQPNWTPGGPDVVWMTHASTLEAAS